MKNSRKLLYRGFLFIHLSVNEFLNLTKMKIKLFLLFLSFIVLSLNIQAQVSQQQYDAYKQQKQSERDAKQNQRQQDYQQRTQQLQKENQQNQQNDQQRQQNYSQQGERISKRAFLNFHGSWVEGQIQLIKSNQGYTPTSYSFSNVQNCSSQFMPGEQFTPLNPNSDLAKAQNFTHFISVSCGTAYLMLP